jgi:hypothetical protein
MQMSKVPIISGYEQLSSTPEMPFKVTEMPNGKMQ